MANRQLTQKLINDVKKHGNSVLEQVDGAIEAKAIKPFDIDLVTCLESDFGSSYRDQVLTVSDDAMEAIMTSGVFNKMAQVVIRHTLMETPKEAYKLSNAVPSETRGECEESFRDWGVFSDIQVHEVCELEAGPMYGIATDYLEHPNGVAVAAGLAFTREALCKDPNGYLMSQVPKLVDAHNNYREDRLVDALIGYNVTWNRSGTEYDIYYDGGTGSYFEDGSTGPWINSDDSTLTCSDDFQNIKNMFYDMTDLVHGRQLMISTDDLDVLTSDRKRDAVIPLLRATSVEKDITCGAADQHYLMTPEVANGLTFNPMAYTRMVDAIASRYSITTALAREWMWFGHLSEFMAWVYQVRPTVNRCSPGPDQCRRRIVAIYDSYSKGYAYIKDPQKGLLLTGTESASV